MSTTTDYSRITSTDVLPCSSEPDIFFSLRKKDVARAQALCQSCPRLLACLLETQEVETMLGHQLEGVHGGLTKAQRALTTMKKIA